MPVFLCLKCVNTFQEGAVNVNKKASIAGLELFMHRLVYSTNVSIKS